MGDINKLYDNIKQLAGGKIEVGTVEQFTKALGNQDTAKKIYGNLSTVLTKDQIGSENDFLSFVNPIPMARPTEQNYVLPGIQQPVPTVAVEPLSDEEAKKAIYGNAPGTIKIGDVTMKDFSATKEGERQLHVPSNSVYNDLPKTKIRTIESEPEQNGKYMDILSSKPQEKGFLSTGVGDALEKFEAGAIDVFGNTFGAINNFPSMLLGLPTPERTDVQIAANEVAEYIRRKADRYKGKDFKQLWKEDNVMGAAGDIALAGAESLPASLLAMFGGGAGLLTTGASSMTQQYDKLRDNKTMSEDSKRINSMLNGTIQVASEFLGDVPIGNMLKGIATKTSAKAVGEAIGQGLKGWIGQSIKKAGLLFPPVGEGLEEIAAQVGTNVTDYITGARKDWNPFDGAFEAGVYGMGAGAGFSVAGGGMQVAQNIQSKKEFKQADTSMTAMLSRNGYTKQESEEIKQSLLTAKLEDRNKIVVAISGVMPDAIKQVDGKTQFNPEISNVFANFFVAADNLQATSSKFDKQVQAETLSQEQQSQSILQQQKDEAAQQLARMSNKTTGTIQTVKLKDNSEIQIANGTPIFKEDGTFDAENTGIITHNPKDENGNPVLNEDGTPKILVVDPNSIMSLVSDTPVQEAQAEAGSQIDQAVAENEKNDFYPKTYTDYPTEDGQWRVSVNETTGKLEKQKIEINENAKDEQGRPIVYEIDDPINITDEEYSQMSGKPIPTSEVSENQNERPQATISDQSVLSTEPIVSTEPSTDLPQSTPTYPTDKNGNVDFKSMTDEQIFNHTKETKGEEAAHSLIGRQIIRLQGQIQDNTRATNKHNEETNKLLAKAKTMQDEVAIQAKQDAKEVSLKEEYTTLNSKLGELQSLLPKVEVPAPIETPKVVTTRPEILQLQKEQSQANLDSSETLTPNLATSSEVLQPNVDTSNEVQEKPAIEQTPTIKPKETPFQKRTKELGEYIDMKDYILRIIAGGQKIKWKGGLESEFRGSNAERLQRRNYIDETNGLTPTELAHQIWNDYGENGNNGEIPGVYNMSDGEILDEVHEVLRTVKSNSDALLQAEERRAIGTYDPTPEEAQIIDAFDDEMFAAVLGITNFTPEQITTLNEQLHGWSEYIQYEQNSINPGTTPTSESNSTESNAISEEGSIDSKIAGQEPNLNPTDRQKEAGNYKLAHITISGMDISVENPVGSLREGKDEDGRAWSHEMKSHYGYFKGTVGRDGDHIDVFTKSNTPEDYKGPIFVIDQVYSNGPKSGLFDESKVMLGYDTAKEAEQAYMENYDKDWNGLSDMTEVSVDDFKKWLYDGAKQAKPFADYKETPESLKQITESPIKNGSTVTYKGKQYTINGITSDGKFVDLYEGDKMIHEDIPVESVSNSETLQQSDKTKLSKTNNEHPNNQKIAKTENVESLPKSEPSEKVGEQKSTKLLDTLTGGEYSKSNEKVSQAQKEADEALNDFMSAFNDIKSVTNDINLVEESETAYVSPEKQAKMLVAGTKMIGAYTKLGIYKFDEILKQLQSKGIQITEDLLSALKKSYGAFAAENDINELDDIKTVRATKLEDLTQTQNNQPKTDVILQDQNKDNGSTRRNKQTKSQSNGLSLFDNVETGTSFGNSEGTSRGEQLQFGNSSSQSGVRPEYDLSKSYTNDEINEIVSTVTTLKNGKIELTGEVTDDIKTIASRYVSGGVAKQGRGILDEYYTSSKIVDQVRTLISKYFPQGKSIRVLEPSVGTGSFLNAIPTDNSDVVAFEINETTARIAKIFNPTAEVNLRSFETEFIDDSGKKKPITRKYDLVIGNPPYGEHRGMYKGLGEESKITKYEDYFVKRSLDVLDEGGILAMVLPSSWMDRHKIESGYVIEASYRLPSGAFESTQIGTDIVILKKQADYIQAEPHNYFEKYPENILGEVKERSTRFGRMEQYISGDIDTALSKIEQNTAKTVANELNVEPSNDNLNGISKSIDETGSKDKSKKVIKASIPATIKVTSGKVEIKKGTLKYKLKKGDEVVPASNQFPNEFTPEQESAFKDADYSGIIPKDKYEQHKQFANFLNFDWVHDFYYAEGNIYQKLEQLERDKQNMSQEQYDKQKKMLKSVLPKTKPIEKISLSPNTEFVKNLTISTTNSASGTISLKDLFESFVRKLPRDAFGNSNSWEVMDFVNNNQVYGSDKERNSLVRERRKATANDLFKKFLAEEVLDTERSQIEYAFNREYNAMYRPDYSKVPMFSSINKNFKGKPLQLTIVQRAGVGRSTVKGVGILAHEVGFGKTLSGILSVHEAMTRGTAKKPLIVAPNEGVLKQWIDTIYDVLPYSKINVLGNLGVDYDLTGFKVDDNDITLVTYEGFKQMGFKDDTYDSLSRKFSYISDDLSSHKSERDRQKDKTKQEELSGKMRKGKAYDFEDFGFDHLTFDEVHNANHIVGKVKLDKKDASDFRSQSQRTSDLGIKTWLASQYIQENNDGRNVLLLSATPFTNKPLEYYSILSLVGNSTLERMGFFRVDQFFETFMEADNDIEIKANGTPAQKTNVRRFKNNGLFNQLLSEFIDIKGEDDNPDLIRPERHNREYKIPQNDLTISTIANIQELFNDNASVLSGITQSRLAAFSPYSSYMSFEKPKDYKEFVKNSPKIDTAIRLIEQNKKNNPEGGQLIYSEIGVEFFPMIQEYLIKKSGFKPNEVKIISGATSLKERANIQSGFNKGDIKVIIGSPAIKEGINLQENTTDMYILSLPYNFTQLRQVEGRSWRHGNKWSNIRVNYMLTDNSVDVFLLQRLQIKQGLYNEAMKSGQDTVDISDIDTSELKTALITDPTTRVNIELMIEKGRLESEKTRITSDLAFVHRKYERYNELKKKTDREINSLKQREEWAKTDPFWARNLEFDRRRVEVAKSELDQEKQKLAEKGVNVDDIVSQETNSTNQIAEIDTKIESLKEKFNELVSKYTEENEAKANKEGDVVETYIKDRETENKGDFYTKRAKDTDPMILGERTAPYLNKTEDNKAKSIASNSEFVKNSKVKDVVYHGGANDISIFDKTKLGSYSGADSAKKGFFFTNDKTLAEDFAYDASFVISKYKQPDILKLIEKSDFDKIGKHAVGIIKDDYDFEAYDSVNDYLNQNGYINSEIPSEKEYKEAINKFASENLYYGLNDSETVNEYKTIFKNLGIEVGKVSEVNINIENPLVVEKKIDFSDEDGLTHYIDEAIKNGNDGVIFNSVTEIIGGSKKTTKQYVVFEPTQIKSATGNNGSFSENNANFVEEKQIAYENEQEAIQKTIDFVSSERPTRIPLNNSRGYAEIHKRSVVEGFKESGYVDFVGRKINSIDDVVDMWNIHRSPYIEKSHIIFVKDGSIIGTTATTLNKVGITAFGKVEDIETLYNKFGADGMYLLHNHPSGNHKPSSGDIQTTQKIKDLLPEVNLIGHIVIDHDKYSYIDPTKDGYKEFEQKNAPAKLFYERELVGNNPQKRLFEISKALLNGEGLKGAIIYLSPKLDINAYDVFPEGATQETISELTKQGLKNNLGQVAIITHDGTFDKDWKVPANVVAVIDTKTGYSTYFENEKPDVITSDDVLKLWEPTTNYPKPQPPVFTSADTLVDQARKIRDYEETLKRWQERQIGNLATQNGERLSPATISKLNKDINSVTSKLWEGWADAALPIKEFQKFLEKNGVPISDNDNYYMRLTTVPSRIEYRFNQFKEETMKPFIATLKAIEKNGFTYDDITTYAKLKHGPEYTANIFVREYTNKIEAERAKIEDVTGSKDWTTKNQKLDQKLIDFKSTIFDYIEQQGIDYAGRDSIEKRIGETADNFITNFESKNGSLVDDFWKQSKEVSHYALDEEVRGGMRTREWADGIKNMFEYYVPLKGHREPTAETTWDYSMEHGDFFFSAVKKGKGRTSESDDPFSVMESTVRSAIGAAEQNLQLQSIRRLALKDTTGSMTVSKTWFVKVGEDENGNPEFKVADEVPFEDTDTNETYNDKVAKFEAKMKELKSKGEAYQGGSERLKLGLWIKPTNEREHEVVVKSNGESYTIRFHTSPRVPQAINGTNMRFYEGTFGAVLNGLGWATRHMAGFKTLWRPAFILVTNPLRDIHAGLNLAFIDEGAKFTANTVLNFRHAQAALLRRSLNKHDLSNKYDKMLNDFMVLGGKTGISKIMELKEIQRSIEKSLKAKINPIEKVFDFYHTVSDVTENQMRFAVYISAIDKGYSSLKATSMAKEATVNFDRKGNGRNGLRELKATYAFINVGFQALDNIYSKSTKNTETKKRALLAIAANVLSGSLLVAAINTAMCALFGWDEDKWLEDFSKRSSFARNANFTIWTPEKLIDIPLGQEFRMYHGLGMDLMMMSHGKVSVMETSMNMIKGLSSQLPYNPIESSLQGSWASAMPDFASPLAELAANKSWLGYGIYKQNQDEAAPGYTKIKTNKKGEPYAPEVMIKLSKWLNEGTGGDVAEAGWLGFVNPDIADHLLGGYFAGIYEQPLTLLEATLSDKEGSLIKELTPRAILKNTADIQSRDTGLNEKYYKAKDEAEKVDKLIGRAEKAIELLDKNNPDYEAQKEKYQSKIDKLKTDDLYDIQGTQKTISALEKSLDEISPKEQVKTEKEISELKKNIVKISSGEKVDPKNYTEYISKYYGTVKKIEEYKAKRVLGGEKNAELDKISGKLYASPGKMKSIHSVINLLEKDTKKNPSNREKNEAKIITLIKKL